LLVAAGFQEQSRYRLAALGGLVANATFGLLKVAILFATVDAAGGQLAGYDVSTMSAYIWIGALLVGMATPDSPVAYLLGSVSLLLAMILSAATVYLVAAAGFWIVETRGLQLLYMVAAGFLAGLFVPLWLFPAWLQAIALATPFPSLLMFPTDILSGRTTGLAAVGLVGAQLLWLVVVVTVGQSMTRLGRRHLEVQGG
jgi:ABC-2 type transport system permease protein